MVINIRVSFSPHPFLATREQPHQHTDSLGSSEKATMNTKQSFTVTCEKPGSPNSTISKTETGPASHAVINALAEIKETEQEDLEPLYSVIDPDALDRLFQNLNQDESRLRAVSFSYESHDVTITPATHSQEQSSLYE